MPFTTRRRRDPVIGTSTTTRTRKRGGIFGRPSRMERAKETVTGTPVATQRREGFFTRLTGPRKTRTRAVPVTHRQRQPTIGDKISGFGKRVMGSLKARPGEKAAGTRQMRGTDGRGARTRRRFF